MPNKLRILFLGRKNPFTLGLIDWLGLHFDVVGAFFVEPDRFSLRARWARIKRRIDKYGVCRVIDELAFHAWYRVFDRRLNRKLMKAGLPDRFTSLQVCPAPHWDVPDPHNPEWIQKLAALRPDLVFVDCCALILKGEFSRIPRFGAFVLHQSITPEYRGLHTPLWALVNHDVAGIGYSLVQITGPVEGKSERVNNGPILVQGQVPFETPDLRAWGYIGEAVLVAGLPAVEQAFRRLADNGHFEPVNVEGRASRCYTWMRLSVYLKALVRSKTFVLKTLSSSQAESGSIAASLDKNRIV